LFIMMTVFQIYPILDLNTNLLKVNNFQGSGKQVQFQTQLCVQRPGKTLNNKHIMPSLWNTEHWQTNTNIKIR